MNRTRLLETKQTNANHASKARKHVRTVKVKTRNDTKQENAHHAARAFKHFIILKIQQYIKDLPASLR